MEFGAGSITYDPFLFHSQITKPSLVDDSWNDLWCIHGWDEILKVPTVTVAKDGMRKKSEGGESVQQGEKNGQSAVEDDDWDSETSDSAVVVALKRERG